MGDINSLYEAYTANNRIDPKYYEKFNVKRGLRNPDGSGVMAGVTNICNVHGYVINEGEKSPDEGKLVFRGYNINDLVSNVVALCIWVFLNISRFLFVDAYRKSRLASFQYQDVK